MDLASPLLLLTAGDRCPNRRQIFRLGPIFHGLSLCLLLLLSPTNRELQASDRVRSLQGPGCFTPDFPNDWLFFAGTKSSQLSDTWKWKPETDSQPAVLICQGNPHGYLRTARTFSNFQMSLEWNFPKDANGNSGILLFTSDEQKLWPASIQVQLYQPEAGMTFPVGSARADNELRKVPALSRGVNQWNRCEILSIDGTVTVTVNGKTIGYLTGCEPRTGGIALQSEGSEIHFRNIMIRELLLPPESGRTTDASPAPVEPALPLRDAMVDQLQHRKKHMRVRAIR
jgi:hypothetical protein